LGGWTGLWKAGSHRYAQGPHPIPRHQAWMDHSRCVNLVARGERVGMRAHGLSRAYPLTRIALDDAFASPGATRPLPTGEVKRIFGQIDSTKSHTALVRTGNYFGRATPVERAAQNYFRERYRPGVTP
jgi:hypothetical protein